MWVNPDFLLNKDPIKPYGKQVEFPILSILTVHKYEVQK